MVTERQKVYNHVNARMHKIPRKHLYKILSFQKIHCFKVKYILTSAPVIYARWSVPAAVVQQYFGTKGLDIKNTNTIRPPYNEHKCNK